MKNSSKDTLSGVTNLILVLFVFSGMRTAAKNVTTRVVYDPLSEYFTVNGVNVSVTTNYQTMTLNIDNNAISFFTEETPVKNIPTFSVLQGASFGLPYGDTIFYISENMYAFHPAAEVPRIRYLSMSTTCDLTLPAYESFNCVYSGNTGINETYNFITSGLNTIIVGNADVVNNLDLLTISMYHLQRTAVQLYAISDIATSNAARLSRTLIPVATIWIFVVFAVAMLVVWLAAWSVWFSPKWLYSHERMLRFLFPIFVIVYSVIYAIVGALSGLFAFLVLLVISVIGSLLAGIIYFIYRIRNMSKYFDEDDDDLAVNDDDDSDDAEEIELLAAAASVTSAYSIKNATSLHKKKKHMLRNKKIAHIKDTQVSPTPMELPMKTAIFHNYGDKINLDSSTDNENGMLIADNESAVSKLLLAFWQNAPLPFESKHEQVLVLSFVLCITFAVVAIAVFDLNIVSNYFVYNRITQQNFVEIQPIAIAKGINLLYAYSGFANGIRVNNVLFPTITQMCGPLFSKLQSCDACNLNGSVSNFSGKSCPATTTTECVSSEQRYKTIYLGYIHEYDVNMTIFERTSYVQYDSVNDWFTRALTTKYNVRPLANPGNFRIISSPADSNVMVFQAMPRDARVWIKDSDVTPYRLLGGPQGHTAYSDALNHGSMALFRLAPQDYHRFHSPVSGTITSIYRISGSYQSVDADAMTSGNGAIYNTRTVILIETQDIGQVAVVPIGALCIASITIYPIVGENVERGQLLGQFAFGGSTIVVLFEHDTVSFDIDLVQHSEARVETALHVGNRIGISVPITAET